MSAADVAAFATRALRGHGVRTGLTLLAVAIGVTMVIVLTALGEGARSYVVREFESLGSTLLIVLPGKTETTGAAAFTSIGTHDLTLDDAEAIMRRVRGVEKIAPMVVGAETVAHGDRRRQVAVIGATGEFLEVRRLSLGRGRFLPGGDWRRGPAVVVLGAETARELFPSQDAVGQVVRIADLRARVVGVLAPRGTQLGTNMDEVAIVPVARAMRLFNRRSLFRILIDVRTHAGLDDAKHAVTTLLAARHGEEDVTVITQDAVVSSFSRILQALTLAVAAIAAISLAVAGLGIMNVMLVSVAERTAEVGLLRAVGAGRAQVAAVFLAEAALLALGGGLLGLGAGGAAVWALAALYPALHAAPPAWAVASALGLAVVIGLVFGVVPARQAARLDPVTALGRR